MNYKDVTIETYDKSAEGLADYFKGIGARTEDIDRAIELRASNDHELLAIEIGCGDGRDAEEIIKRVSWYEGFDPSEGLLKLARARLPHADFVKADAMSYDYPENIDIVFAFASLLHVDKDEFRQVCRKIHAALTSGGIFYLSLKTRNEYQEEPRTDEHGERMFYYYTPELVEELAGAGFEKVHLNHSETKKSKWIEMAFRKV